MIKIGDKVKVVKLNSNVNSCLTKLIGQVGMVLGIEERRMYKYRVEIAGVVLGFQEGEVKNINAKEVCSTVTIRDIAISIAELVEKKNHDYNNSFDKTLEEYGDTAYFLRIEDKLSRLKSLVNKEAAVDESIEDTLKDIVGYTLLMLNNKLKK